MPETIQPNPEVIGEEPEEEIEEVEVSADDEEDDAELVEEESLGEMVAEDEDNTAEQLQACKEKLAEHGLSDEAIEIAAKKERGEEVTEDEEKQLAAEALPDNNFKAYAVGSTIVIGGALYAGFKIMKLLLWDAWRHGGHKSFGSAVKDGYKQGEEAAKKLWGLKDEKKK